MASVMKAKLLSASTAASNPRRNSSPQNKSKAYLALAILSLCALSAPAHAQAFSELYNFQGTPDGETPYGGVVADSTGAFYGTTSVGGTNSCGGNGCGTVYKLVGGKENWVYSFKGYPSDGETPGYISLVTDGKGNFYGTTAYGGNGPCELSGVAVGCGTIFSITSAGVETVLYNFQWGPSDGAGPNSPLILDTATGVLYGTTEGGGNLVEACMQGAGCGTIFSFTIASKKEKVLYKFCTNLTSCPDGAGPSGVLVHDTTSIYGTTAGGGAQLDGTVYKFAVAGAKESVLYNFCTAANCTDGEGPMGGLAINTKTATLYGTTVSGGTAICGGDGTPGGTLFQITTAGKSFTVLHNFPTPANDGCGPWGTVTMDTAGNLYGTTFLGGSGGVPLGTVYEYSASGQESVLYNFDGINGIGSAPLDTLLFAKGSLYGTASAGGTGTECSVGVNGVTLGGCGLVFKLTP
jgi:uncharacterized repeat protein (TIGR03803 family)